MSNVAMMMGLSSGAGGVDVADVFSTDLYTGNASTQDIVNGLDLSTDGGMVWFARRNGAEEKNIFSTDAPNKYIRTTSYAGQGDITTGITAYNTDGFSLGGWNNVNGSGDTMVSWSWKKAPKFFDVVTWTGDGVAGRTVSHNFGAVPAVMIVKCTSTNGQWGVYHHSTSVNPQNDYLLLNTSASAYLNQDLIWNNTAPTSTEFTLGSNTVGNGSGRTYVAYLFAHNEDLIQCGSYTGNGSTTGPEIDLGWQPQWVMIKNTSTSADWYVLDAERGLNGDAIDDPYLRPNLTSAESSTNILKLTATGFQLNSAGLTGVNRNGDNYIYMAIKAED